MSKYPLKDFYQRIYKNYDLVNTVFTFGNDSRWRKHAAKVLLADKPGDILDLCCGTGKFTYLIANNANYNCQITGYDFTPEMLEIARENGLEKYVNIKFIEGDASDLPFANNTFDAIGIAFGFRNLTYNSKNENRHISEIYRVLKPGGKLYILESGSPANAIIQIFYQLYLFLFLVPVGGVLTGNFKAYYYLAVSSRHYYSKRQMKVLLKCFGFEIEKVKKYLFGATNLFVVSKSDEK